MPTPTTTSTIDKVRAIVANRQYAKVDGVLVDGFTASAIIAVYDNLSPEAQAKMAAMSVAKMGLIALKLVNR